MRQLAIARILGIFLVIHSFGLLPPLALSWYYNEGQHSDFLIPFALTTGTGLLLWVSSRHAKVELRRHEGFIIVATFWVVLSTFSALPFMIGPHLDFVDAFFEATSAFTTTGATVMTQLEALPKSVLFYRQELQWLGGMGIIVLAIAILPLLGMGGMQLYRAETPGPMKSEKLTPRIIHTARTFWLIYLTLTLSCALAYFLAGMTLFDAVSHSLSTVSTGGFSTHDASIHYYDSLPVEVITEAFMFLGAVNFSVHFLVFHKHDIRHYFTNSELQVFFLIIFATIMVTTIILYMQRSYDSLPLSLRHASFQVISIITSTGYSTENFSVWPSFIPVLLIFISFIGGCSGSTAGGMKVIRVMLLFKQGYNEILTLIHPNMVRHLKISKRVFPPDILRGVWGFFALYLAIFVIVLLILLAGGLDQVTAFSAVATCMNNLGPGLGEVTSNFQSIADWQKLLLVFCMLLGRLEIMTLFVLLTPSFWKR